MRAPGEGRLEEIGQGVLAVQVQLSGHGGGAERERKRGLLCSSRTAAPLHRSTARPRENAEVAGTLTNPPVVSPAASRPIRSATDSGEAAATCRMAPVASAERDMPMASG